MAVCGDIGSLTFNQRVVGSIPTALTNKIKGFVSFSLR